MLIVDAIGHRFVKKTFSDIHRNAFDYYFFAAFFVTLKVCFCELSLFLPFYSQFVLVSLMTVSDRRSTRNKCYKAKV